MSWEARKHATRRDVPAWRTRSKRKVEGKAVRYVTENVYLREVNSYTVQRLFLPGKLGVSAYAATAPMRMSRIEIATEFLPAQS